MDIIVKYFPFLDSVAFKRFEALQGVYEDWNDRINLISRKDFVFFNERHLLHSLSIGMLVKFKDGTKILDVGTGGGFPGIPLAILFPGVEFCLADSITKKCNVVKSVAAQLNLKNVNVFNGRAEDLKMKFDFVVSRAVAPMPLLWKWTGKLLTKNSFNDIDNGLLCLKGGELTEELDASGKNYRIWELADVFEEEYFLTKKLIHSW